MRKFYVFRIFVSLEGLIAVLARLVLFYLDLVVCARRLAIVYVLPNFCEKRGPSDWRSFCRIRKSDVLCLIETVCLLQDVVGVSLIQLMFYDLLVILVVTEQSFVLSATVPL